MGWAAFYKQHRALVLAVAFSAGFLLAVAACTPAQAWEITKSSNGVVLVRASDDSTATQAVLVYSSYKGGETFSPSFSPISQTSYAANVNYGSFLGAAGDAVEVPLVPDGGRVQMVYLSPDGSKFVVLYEPLRVSAVGTVPVSIAATVPVSMDATLPISVDTTLPVTLAGVSDLTDLQNRILGYLCGAALGIAVFAGLYRVWRGRD